MSLRGVETVLHAHDDQGRLIDAVCIKNLHDAVFETAIVSNFRRIYEKFSITERTNRNQFKPKEKTDENSTEDKVIGSIPCLIDRESESKDADDRFIHQVPASV